MAEECTLAHPGRQVLCAGEGDCTGNWDSGRIAQLLTNLVSNALQHGPEDLPVHVRWEGRGREVVLEVANAGRPSRPRSCRACSSRSSVATTPGEEASAWGSSSRARSWPPTAAASRSAPASREGRSSRSGSRGRDLPPRHATHVPLVEAYPASSSSVRSSRSRAGPPQAPSGLRVHARPGGLGLVARLARLPAALAQPEHRGERHQRRRQAGDLADHRRSPNEMSAWFRAMSREE